MYNIETCEKRPTTQSYIIISPFVQPLYSKNLYHHGITFLNIFERQIIFFLAL